MQRIKQDMQQIIEVIEREKQKKLQIEMIKMIKKLWPHFTNQKFCYWLQGYFEIGDTINLDYEKIALINLHLLAIDEPLGIFTEWLSQVLHAIAGSNYAQSSIDFYAAQIQDNLNKVFLHVIDPTYDHLAPRDRLQAIHQGKE